MLKAVFELKEIVLVIIAILFIFGIIGLQAFSGPYMLSMGCVRISLARPTARLLLVC